MNLMGKKHLLPKENEEFLDRLGLTETDKKVYIATLDGGLVSAGEIQQLTEIMDLGQILESVRDLIDIGLVKKALGMMPRYYATLPFLRETLSVEREFKFGLESMLQSLNTSKEKTKQNRERIEKVKFPKIVENLLDEYYKNILEPVVNDLEKIEEEAGDKLLPLIREMDEHNETIKNQLQQMSKPLLNYTDLQSQKFALGVGNEQDQFKQYIVERKQNRLKTLQKAHKSISNNIEELKNGCKDFVSSFDQIKNDILTADNKLQKSVEKINDQIASLTSNLEFLNSARDELKAEFLVAREKIKRIIDNPNFEDPNSEIDKTFNKLIDINNKNVIDPSQLQAIGSAINEMVHVINSEVHSLSQKFTEDHTELSSKFETTLEQLKNDMTQIFNQINDQDESSLQEFRSKIINKLQSLESSIKEEGSAVKNKIIEHTQQIIQKHQQAYETWEEDLTSIFSRPIDVVKPFLNNWIDEIEPIINNFKEESNNALKEILEPILTLETQTFSTLTERISFIKAMIEGRSKDLQQIMEFAKQFDFTKQSDTWVVVGLPAIYASLTDQLLRSKNKVTVVTPHLDLELVELARKMRSSIRITFVADIDEEKDARLIKKLADIGQIRLRDYPDRDLYACIRDSEEIIFGYIREEEITAGIRSSTPSIVKLLEDRFNETVIRNSKEIRST